MITKTTLDAMASVCPSCGKEHTTIALCCTQHEDAGLQVSYVRGSGILALNCAECGALVADVLVRDDDEQPVSEYTN